MLTFPLSNPYPAYASIREEHPVFHVQPEDMWIISRYEDVKAASKDFNRFTVEKRMELMSPPWLSKKCQHDLFVISQNPSSAKHGQYRALVNTSAFMARSLSKLRPFMEEIAESLIATFVDKQEVEFIEHFAYPYVNAVFARVTGLDDAIDSENVRKYTQAMELLYYEKPEDHIVEYIEDTYLRQQLFYTSIITDRRIKPQSDIVSELIKAEIDGEALSDAMIRSALDILFRGGYQNPVHVIGNGLLQLAKDPTLLSSVLRQPEKIPAFVDELLRLYSPAPISLRHTTQPVTLHGITIPAEAPVLLLLAAANRDPRRYTNPDSFEFNRKPKDYLTFGNGPNICIGMALTRIQTQVAFECLLSHISNISCLSADELEWVDSPFVHGVTKLPANLQYHN